MFITTAAAAKILGCTKHTACKMAQDGFLHGQKVGLAWALDEEQVREVAKTYVSKTGAGRDYKQPRKILTGIPAIHAEARLNVIEHYVDEGIPEEEAKELLERLLAKASEMRGILPIKE